MRSYSQLSEFDLLLDLDLDKMESLPDINVAINRCKFHHSSDQEVVHKQTDKQTNTRQNITSAKLRFGGGNKINLKTSIFIIIS